MFVSVPESSVFYRHAGSIGAVSDLLLFSLLVTVGLGPTQAHVVSLLVCWPLYYLLHLPFRKVLRDDSGWLWGKLFGVVAFSVMLLVLRGGAIFAMSSALYAHPIVAFLPALLITFAGNLLYERFVFNGSTSGALSFGLLSSTVFLVGSKFLYLNALELLPEESYYWLYAVHPSTGYIDHPPMVGWLIWIGTHIFGTNEFGVRFFAPLCSMAGALFISLLYRRIYGAKGAFLSFVLALSLPYINGAGFFMSPDAPLLVFWSLALLFLHRAVFEGKGQDWLVFGVVIGLGMLSKYTIVLLGLPALALLIIVRDNRRWFFSPHIYIAAALALLVFSPVIYWNFKNEWASFVFQGPRRLQSSVAFSTHRFILDMLCLVTPSVFFAGWIFLFRSNKQIFSDPAKKHELFMKLCFILPCGVFLFYSLRHVPKLNWSGPSYLALLPFVAHWLSNRAKVESRLEALTRRSFLPVMMIWFGIFGFALHYLGLGLPLVPYSEKMHRAIGWRALADKSVEISQRFEAQIGARPVLVGMDKHNIAAQLWFYVTKKMGVELMPQIGSRNIVGDEALMFRYWSPLENFVGKTIVMIARSEADLNDERVVTFFDNVGPIEPLELQTGWSKTKTYYMRVGYSYKGASEQALFERAPQLMPEQLPKFTPAPPDLSRS